MKTPTLSRDQILGVLPDDLNEKVLFVGIRGFGINGFQLANSNKIGIYDDAIFLLTPDEVIGFNANTDPSRDRKNIAVLQPGTYWWKQDLHGIRHFADLPKDKAKEVEQWLRANKGKDHAPIEGKILPYWAYRQASPVTVLRNGHTEPETILDAANWPMINGHRGGYNTTSSEGCQTFFPDRWEEARARGYAAMDKYGMKKISYTLVNQ